MLNDRGVVSSYADTQDPDPFAPDFCFDADCLVAHAYRWRRGVMSDLGTLADGYSSLAAAINDRGWSLGASQTGIIDPLFGFPQSRAVLWTRLRITCTCNKPAQTCTNLHKPAPAPAPAPPLPSLPPPSLLSSSSSSSSSSSLINDPGDIAGSADLPTPGIHDAVRWRNGHILDLGTVDGDACSRGRAINSRGQIVRGLFRLPKFPARLCLGGWRSHAGFEYVDSI